MSDGLTHAVAGAAGGVTSTLLTYPLVTISSRMAVQNNDKSAGAYKNTADALQKIIFREGVSGLYSGLSSAIFGISITNGVYYFWYETVKAYFTSNSKKAPSTLNSMVSGAIAGAATTIITNPIWVVNTRMTVQKKEFKKTEVIEDSATTNLNSAGAKTSEEKKIAVVAASKPLSTSAVFFQILREDGPSALWQGIVPALILVSNPIIQYTVFEHFKSRAETLLVSRGRKLTSFHFFVLGAVSKLCATFTTFPYIVIKSRMQLKQSATDSAARYNSVFEAFSKILAHEGPAGLYKGLGSKLTQSVLAAAILFSAKENFYNFAVLLLRFAGLKQQKAVAASAPSAGR